MRILLANHHLDDRGGSELYTTELAEALQTAGHDTAVFSFMPGRLADHRLRPRGIPVFSSADGQAIEEFAPDLIHAHHSPCLYFLGGLRLRAAVVYSSLGWAPLLESAPVIWAGVGAGLAISEEVRDALAPTPFARDVPLHIVRNWFDDRGMTRQAPAPRERRPRWVVVTNHLDRDLAGALTNISSRRPFEWVQVGAPDNSREVNAELLKEFDGVITIGRTALLAGAMGIPCLLHDVHGSDGLLEAPGFAALSTRNFSGRLTGSRPSVEQLEHQLFDLAPRLDTASVADLIWSGYRLSSRVQDFEGHYQAATESGRRLDDDARDRYGKVGWIHAEYVQQLLHWRARAAAASEAHQQSDARAAQIQSALDALSERMDREDQVAWALVDGLRSARERVLPTGSRRRRAYDHGLRRLKSLGLLGSLKPKA